MSQKIKNMILHVHLGETVRDGIQMPWCCGDMLSTLI